MVGLLFVGVFVAVCLAYACTEYVLLRFDTRRKVLTGEGRTLLVILASNTLSFAVLLISALIFVEASGTNLYLGAAIVCACAQAIWLGQHLWFYYRDHLRMHYEN